MLKSDKNTLISFIDNYSLKEVLSTISDIMKEKSNEMVDKLLKEKAIIWADYSTYLDVLVKKVKD